MPYTAGTNVWPTAYEADGVTAQPKVGKYHGERYVGNVAGVTVNDGDFKMVWEFDVANYADAELKTLKLPESHGIVTAVYVETEEAFTTGDVDVTVAGTTVLAAVAPVDGAVGMASAVLTATVANLSIAAGEAVAIALSGVTGTVGKCKVVVEVAKV